MAGFLGFTNSMYGTYVGSVGGASMAQVILAPPAHSPVSTARACHVVTCAAACPCSMPGWEAIQAIGLGAKTNEQSGAMLMQ